MRREREREREKRDRKRAKERDDGVLLVFEEGGGQGHAREGGPVRWQRGEMGRGEFGFTSFS